MRAAGPKPAAIYADVLRTYARNWRPLLVTGTAILVPLGLLDAVAGELGTVGFAERATVAQLAPAVTVVLVATITALVGDVLYVGAVAALVVEPERRPSLRSLARRLAIGRLVAVDLIIAIGTAVGLVLLIVPGILVFVWFSLAAPVVEMEGRRVGAALARSRQLVRGRFWRVFAVLIPLAIVTELAAEAGGAVLEGALGDSFVAHWVTESALEVLLVPLYAIAAVLLAVQAIRTEGRPADPAA